jgi:hypothetical protein
MGWAPHDRGPARLVTLLHPPRPGETCPIAAVTASKDVAHNGIRLADGEVVVLDEGEFLSQLSG